MINKANNYYNGYAILLGSCFLCEHAILTSRSYMTDGKNDQRLYNIDGTLTFTFCYPSNTVTNSGDQQLLQFSLFLHFFRRKCNTLSHWAESEFPQKVLLQSRAGRIFRKNTAIYLLSFYTQVLTVGSHQRQEKVGKMELVLAKHSSSDIVVFYASPAVEECGAHVCTSRGYHLHFSQGVRTFSVQN